MVFKKLPPEDLKSVILVCKQWKEAVDKPELWTGVIFSRKGDNSRDKLLLKMMRTRRFEAVEEILFQRCDFVHQLLFKSDKEFEAYQLQHPCSNAPDVILQGILQHKGLKKMSMESYSICKAEPKLLAQVLVNMEEVIIWDEMMSAPQKEAFFMALQKPNNLERLHMCRHNDDDGYYGYISLPSMAPNLIVNALRNIEKIELKMAPIEAEFLLNNILRDSFSVKSLFLRETKLSHIDPETLAGAVTKMEEINLSDAALTPGQLTSLMTALCERTSLRVLTLGGVDQTPAKEIIMDLSHIPAIVVSLAITNLEAADLNKGSLSPQQVKALCTALNYTSMQRLQLWGVDLSAVKPRVIARMVQNVEHLDLSYSQIDTERLDKNFATTAENPGKLKILKLMGMGFQPDIDGDTLARAVNRLEKAVLVYFLTGKQVNKILREALVSTKLKKLVIRRAMLARDIDQSLFNLTMDVVGLSNWEHSDYLGYEMIETQEEANGGDGNEDFDDGSGDDDVSDYGDASDASDNDYNGDEEKEADDDTSDNGGDSEGDDDKQPLQPTYQGCQNGQAQNDSGGRVGSYVSSSRVSYGCGVGADSGGSGEYDRDRGRKVGGVPGGQKRDNNGGFRQLASSPSYDNYCGAKSYQGAKKRKVTLNSVKGDCLRCDLCNVTSNSKHNHEEHMNGKRHFRNVLEM